jgi:RNA polymerase sporulation-specific sigma factor
MIIGEIRRYLRDNSAVRVSRSMRDTAYRVMQVKESLVSRGTSASRRRGNCERIGFEAGGCGVRNGRHYRSVSLYEPMYSDGGDTICVMDQVKDGKKHGRHVAGADCLKEAIKQLTDRERHILALRFFEGKTQMEVSAEVEFPRRRYRV